MMALPSRDRIRQFLPPPSVACGLLLAATAVGLEPAIAMLVERFSKQTIAIRKSLDAFDLQRLPSFRIASDGEVSKQTIAAAVETDEVLLVGLERRGPASGIRREPQMVLFVTYYSDPREQIPHTPEVCYRQAGTVVRSLQDMEITVPELGPGRRRVDVRLLDLEKPGWRLALLYTFVCNGSFYSDREKVRWAIGTPGDPYVYFSKIEAVTSVPPGTSFADAVEWCRRLLGEALPLLIEEHLPTRAQVAGREPPPASSEPAPARAAPRSR